MYFLYWLNIVFLWFIFFYAIKYWKIRKTIFTQSRQGYTSYLKKKVRLYIENLCYSSLHNFLKTNGGIVGANYFPLGEINFTRAWSHSHHPKAK